MYRRWWAVPGLMFCAAIIYLHLVEFLTVKGWNDFPAVLWLLTALCFVLIGLALGRLCTRRAVALGAGVLLLFAVLLTVLSRIPAPDVSLGQGIWSLAILWEYILFIFWYPMSAQTRLMSNGVFYLIIPALIPFLWVPFGKAEP